MKSALFPDIVVNGTVIPSAVIAAETQNHHAPPGKPGLAWRKAARALAVRALLLAEARRRGLVAAPCSVGPGRVETEPEALIRALLDEAIQVAPPDDARVRAEWERAPERFRAPPLWEASHILCACAAGEHPGADAARLRAEALLGTLRKHPRRFAECAARDSDCGSKSSGGALGQLGPGDTVPEFEAVLRQLAEGEMTPAPVRTRYGWHIIRLDAFAEGMVLPFRSARAQLSQAMEKAAWAKAARAFVGRLVSDAEIAGVDM